jgi:[ribosomal protein S5]-alanine N-acetyltransferase
MASASDGVDVRTALTEQVFSRLCQSTLQETTDSSTAAQRLWRLPEISAAFVFNAITDEDKRRLDPLVHRLRAEAGSLINTRLDRTEAKQTLAKRLSVAREELVLRPWRPDDAPTLATLLDNPTLWELLPDEYPGQVTEQLADELIAIANGWSERHVVRAVEWRQRVVGQVRLQFDSSPFSDAAEISYWIGQPYWAQGLATKAVTLFTADSFEERSNLPMMFAQILSGNVASMHVVEKAGYRRESFHYQNVTKRAGRHSTHVYGVCRQDYDFDH